MRGSFSVVRTLPLSRLEVEVGPITLRQALLSQHQAATTPRPDFITVPEWTALHELAIRVRRLGLQPGVTVEELLDLADVDTSELQSAVAEVGRREAAFRGPAAEPPVEHGPGGQVDGVQPGRDGGHA